MLNPAAPEDQARLSAHCELLYVPDESHRAQAIKENAARIQIVLTIGSIGLTADEIAQLPKLTWVAVLGVGFEKVDVAAAASRGIPVTNGAGTNAVSVADHAFALLLAVIRDIPAQDKSTREGVWRSASQLRPGVSGLRMGILGLGAIGRNIAHRAKAFDMPVGYHNRKPRDDAGDMTYFESPLALATWADILMVATPGGRETLHLVNREVLDALGPKGFIVNIARGSVVDTQAVADALHAGTLGGAGLDVYESEPAPPTPLFGCPNVVLTPHVGGWSPEAVKATFTCFLDNLARHQNSEPLQNRV